MPVLDIALAVLTQILWGPTFTLVKESLNAWFAPTILVAFAYGLIALIFSPFLPKPKTDPKVLFVLALFGATVQTSLTFYSLNLLPASLAILLMQLQLPIAVVTSWFAGRDKFSAKNAIGCLICLAGLVIVVGRPEGTDAFLGIGAMVLAVLFWAVAQVFIPIVAKDQGIALYAAMARHATPQMLVVALVLESDDLAQLPAVPLQGWLALLGITIFGFALPYSIWYRLLMRRRIDELMPFLLLMPIFGVTAAAWQLGEKLPPSLLTGGAIILAGLAVIVFRRRAVPAS